MPVKQLIGSLLVYVVAALGLKLPGALAQDADLRLIVPDYLVESGLTQHLLPRFRFKTRIRVEAVSEGEVGAASLLPDNKAGVAVLSSAEGVPYFLTSLSEDTELQTKVRKLLDWLQSKPGRAAIESFRPDGEQLFTPGARKIVKEVAIEIEGDANLGSKLALLHCGRCHVIDSRNPFGGIGSTPSFGALKTLPKWPDSFAAFWTINPHPAFTQIDGITEPFDPARPSPIAPIVMTIEEVEAIASFVAQLPAKDLGGVVEAR
ncbi:MAG: cytochrome c [Hyphomicrobiales bacterium]